jgi:hypothetical protein
MGTPFRRLTPRPATAAGYPDGHPAMAAAAGPPAGAAASVHTQWRAARGPFAVWGADAYAPHPPPLLAVELVLEARGKGGMRKGLGLARFPEASACLQLPIRPGRSLTRPPAAPACPTTSAPPPQADGRLAYSPPLEELPSGVAGVLDSMAAAVGRVEDVAAKVGPRGAWGGMGWAAPRADWFLGRLALKRSEAARCQRGLSRFAPLRRVRPLRSWTRHRTAPSRRCAPPVPRRRPRAPASPRSWRAPRRARRRSRRRSRRSRRSWGHRWVGGAGRRGRPHQGGPVAQGPLCPRGWLPLPNRSHALPLPASPSPTSVPGGTHRSVGGGGARRGRDARRGGAAARGAATRRGFRPALRA